MAESKANDMGLAVLDRVNRFELKLKERQERQKEWQKECQERKLKRKEKQMANLEAYNLRIVESNLKFDEKMEKLMEKCIKDFMKNWSKASAEAEQEIKNSGEADREKKQCVFFNIGDSEEDSTDEIKQQDADSYDCVTSGKLQAMYKKWDADALFKAKPTKWADMSNDEEEIASDNEGKGIDKCHQVTKKSDGEIKQQAADADKAESRREDEDHEGN
jgi:hypothetical protein